MAGVGKLLKQAQKMQRGIAEAQQQLSAERLEVSHGGGAIRVTVDGQVWESPGTLVGIANGTSIGGGMRIAPEAQMDDGLLDVVIAGPLSRAGVAAIFPRVYPGRHVSHPACTVLRGTTVLVEPSPVGPVAPPAFADGERLGPLPMRAEIAPGAVHLLV